MNHGLIKQKERNKKGVKIKKKERNKIHVNVFEILRGFI